MTRDEAEKLYLIRNTRYEKYWCPGGGGYTTDLLTAGLYTKEEAEEHIHRQEDQMVSLGDVLEQLNEWVGNDPKFRASCVGAALGVLR